VTFSVTEVVVYGLLAAAIVAGVLYAGGRTPVQIGATAGTIVGFVAVFAIIAPRARRPVEVERADDAPPPAPADTAPPAPAAAAPPPEQRRNPGKRGRRRRPRHAG
jgi:uncharacterized membrane protein